jgi:hypothetical protein
MDWTGIAKAIKARSHEPDLRFSVSWSLLGLGFGKLRCEAFEVVSMTRNLRIDYFLTLF